MVPRFIPTTALGRLSPEGQDPAFVYVEMGLGDTIHFLRFLPMVKERGGTVLL